MTYDIRNPSRALAVAAALIAIPFCAVPFCASAAAAETPLVLAAAQSAIDAPSTVDPGEAIKVSVPGAASGSRVELWGPVMSSASKGALITSAPLDGGAATLPAPSAAGSYELRHVAASGAVLARATLDVAAVPVTLSVPHLVGAGFDTTIHWQGPAGTGDTIQIYDPLTQAVVASAPASGQPEAVNTVTLPAPDRPGAYQIRYVDGKGDTLRSLQVSIDNSRAWLRAPVDLIVGDRFSVQWDGPHGADHRFQVADASGDVLSEAADTPSGGSVGLVAPKTPGDYRIRYVDGADGSVWADVPVQVHPK